MASGRNSSKEADSWIHLKDEDDDLFLLNDSVHLNTSSLRSDEKYLGFDNNVGDTWIYPANFPERAYQYNIVQKALFHNTLVALPTGLGKTFIAAVVMYNMYRWYPMGKVIFMAPTRPLVAQQIEACCKVVGIPNTDSVEVTGKLNKANRAQLWQSKRVFFATPQSVLSDIQDADVNFPFQSVKLIVVDEAHRAKGRYAYTDVLSCVWKKNKYFRILGLSATPGRRKEDVEDVIRNLFISNIEIRTEESVDVVSYVHKRHLKTVVVKLGQRLTEIRDELFAIVDPYLRKLIENRLITGRPGNISRNWLVLEHKKFRENHDIPQARKQELNTDFNICISLYYSIELLERHGVRVFLNNFEQFDDNAVKFVIFACPQLRQLIEKVRADVGPDPFAFDDQSMLNGEIAPIPRHIDFGHPKYEIARDHILAHFESNDKSRSIVFCEYRESVMLMHRLLLQHRPLIRSRIFVGQGGTGSIRAVTQKQQMKIMKDFRSGESNILIATSVAEEGIDVGEVDLIICFDINTTNPTRLVQRIGRTGRTSEGKVILLATEGKEQAILKEVLLERNRINKYISRPNEFASTFYKHSPRMVPTEFNPKCQKTFIQQQEIQISPQKNRSDRPKTKKPKTKNALVSNAKPQLDLRHFFKLNPNLTNEEKLTFEVSMPPVNKSNHNSLSNVELSQFDQMEFSPPKLKSVCNRNMTKVAKFIRANPQTQTVPTKQIITTNRLSKTSLHCLIDFSPDFLSNLWSQMQDLWKKGIDETNIPLKGITPDERQTMRAYSQVVDVLGSKENVKNVVNKRHEAVKPLSYSILKEKYRSIFGDSCSASICCSNTEYLLKKWKRLAHIKAPERQSTNSFTESIIYEEDDLSDNFSKNEESKEWIVHSKYMSQWEDQESNISKSNSTPRLDMAGENRKTLSAHNTQRISIQSTPFQPASIQKPLQSFIGTPTTSKDVSSTSHPIEKIKYEQNIEGLSNFFDDQFDDMIAANSGIIDYIENTLHTPPEKSQSCVSTDTRAKHAQNQSTSANKSTDNTTSLEDNCNEISVNDNEMCYLSNKTIHSNGIRVDVEESPRHSNRKTEKVERRSSPDLFEDLADSVVTKKSSVKANTNDHVANTSPCLLTRNALTWREIRSKYIKDSESKNAHGNSELNESASHMPLKAKRRRIILSESDNSSNEAKSPEKSNVNPGDRKVLTVNRTTRPKLKKKCSNIFIDDEAHLSGSASEDEMENTAGDYMLDSVVVHDDEAENDATNMMQIYLQSVKSPCRKGNFKIPERRRFNDASKIFSQNNFEDSHYVNDSFVVCDEEPAIEQLSCPLERAEEILRNKRRAKRKAKRLIDSDLKLPKKRRILRISNSSDEE